MGFKDDIRTMGAELDRRVTALENLARQIRSEGITPAPSRTTASVGTPVVRTGTYDGITGGRRASDMSTPVAGVDYGAIAFGLSEIGRKVSTIVGHSERAGMREEYEGAVQYFADVFAKSDPTFDADAFKRQAAV